MHVRAVDLTISAGIFRVRSPKICLEHHRIERWYMSRWPVSEWFRDWWASWKIQSLGMTRTVEGNRFREEGNYNKTVSRVRSGKSNADAKDKRWRPVHACFTQSCDQLQGSPRLPDSLMTSRLYFVSCTPTTPTPLYTRKSVQTHPRKR